jgi:hypothetical protein
MIDILTNVQRIFNRAGCRLPSGCEVARDVTGEFIIAKGRAKTYVSWHSDKNLVRSAYLLLERAA